MPLKLHAGQGVFLPKVLHPMLTTRALLARRVPPQKAHPVGAMVPFSELVPITEPPGTYRRNKPPPLGAAEGQLIFRRRQRGAPRRAILTPVEELLGMLDAEPDGQGLRFQGYAGMLEHPVRVRALCPGARREWAFRLFSLVNNNSSSLSLMIFSPVTLDWKRNSAPVPGDSAAWPAPPAEPVRPDMRPLEV